MSMLGGGNVVKQGYTAIKFDPLPRPAGVPSSPKTISGMP